MTRDPEFGQLIAQAQQRLQRILQDADALVMDLVNIHRTVTASAGQCKSAAIIPTFDRRTRIAITNGHRLTDDEAQTVDEDAYDVILDMTALTLRHREDPKGHSTLTLANLQGIGPYRIRILAFLMEHPGIPLCADNVDQLLGDTMRIATPQAVTKNISILRHALGGQGNRNLYICSVPAWESSRRNNARAYRLSPKWKYLLIKHGEFGKSLINHEQGREEVTAAKYNEAHGSVISKNGPSAGPVAADSR